MFCSFLFLLWKKSTRHFCSGFFTSSLFFSNNIQFKKSFFNGKCKLSLGLMPSDCGILKYVTFSLFRTLKTSTKNVNTKNVASWLALVKTAKTKDRQGVETFATQHLQFIICHPIFAIIHLLLTYFCSWPQLQFLHLPLTTLAIQFIAKDVWWLD